MDAKRLRRLSIALALVPLVLAGCGGGGSGSQSGSGSGKVANAQNIVNHDPPRLSEGWTLATVQEEGFAIGLPPGWTQFDLSSSDIEAGMNEVRQANPNMASALSAQVAQLAAQGIKLFAVDRNGNFAVTGFATNLNVIKDKTPDGANLDSLSAEAVAELKKELKTDVPIQVFKNRLDINSGEAERLQYSWTMNSPDGRTFALSVTQYVAINGEDSYILTYSTTDDQFGTYAPLFDKSAKTLTFLESK